MTSGEPPPSAVARLEILPCIAECYRVVFRDFPALTKIALLPIVLSILIGLASSLFLPTYDGVFWHFATLLPWTVLGVAWLRRSLDLDGSAPARFFPDFERRHLRFFVFSLALTLIDLPFWLLPQLLDDGAGGDVQREVLDWAIYALRIYVELRFAFAYAAAAAEEPYSLAFAWRHTRGQSLRVFIIVGLAVVLPWRLFDYVLGGLGLSDFIVYLAWHGGLWITQGVFLTCIAVAFRRSTGWVPKPDKNILERFE
ncbi:MAG: hypothetical protein RH942_09035 [Kiloniellaceae bacterium]